MVIRKKVMEDDKYIEKYSGFLKKNNLEYKNISNYILAFIHRSMVNEKPDFTPKHNERLEFLGDAVLELIITNNLYKDFPKKSEGELTDIRSALVRGRNLAEVGIKLNISEYLLLGKGEELGGGRNNNYLIANTIEAIIGAIYLDFGIKGAKSFIDKHIYSTLNKILNNNLTKDFKTLIQEFTQAEFSITPNYKILNELGPDHNKLFIVGVYLNDKQIGIGKGKNKKKAQENAAKIGFNSLKKELGQQ